MFVFVQTFTSHFKFLLFNGKKLFSKHLKTVLLVLPRVPEAFNFYEDIVRYHGDGDTKSSACLACICSG